MFKSYDPPKVDELELSDLPPPSYADVVKQAQLQNFPPAQQYHLQPRYYPPDPAQPHYYPPSDPAQCHYYSPPDPPKPKRPRDYMIVSIYTLLCCFCPIGFIAVMASIQTRKYYDAGRYELARKSSIEAKKLNIIGIASGPIIIVVLLIIAAICFLFAVW